MKAPKQLRKPENWTDFETLCKKLWGEIWNCPEIKKNGRKGQAQHGVDVYGTPSFDSHHYYGIQCKGKDEYTHKQLSQKEIDEELEKALHFKPQLKKLYFATTAIKDTVVEEYIRKKNFEFKSKGLFEVHLYSWEDIVDLIDENRNTHDWYTKSQNFKTNQSCKLTFHDNTEEITVKIPFKKTTISYTTKREPSPSHFDERQFNSRLINVNFSWCHFRLTLHNTGNTPIEEYKILLRFEGELIDVSKTEKEHGQYLTNDRCNDFSKKSSSEWKIVPNVRILVGSDSVEFDSISVKPSSSEPQTLKIHWKLISKDFQEGGLLHVNISPDYKEYIQWIRPNRHKAEGYKEDKIEDYTKYLNID